MYVDAGTVSLMSVTDSSEPAGSEIDVPAAVTVPPRIEMRLELVDV
jgi:hypothetical protein